MRLARRYHLNLLCGGSTRSSSSGGTRSSIVSFALVWYSATARFHSRSSLFLQVLPAGNINILSTALLFSPSDCVDITRNINTGFLLHQQVQQKQKLRDKASCNNCSKTRHQLYHSNCATLLKYTEQRQPRPCPLSFSSMSSCPSMNDSLIPQPTKVLSTALPLNKAQFDSIIDLIALKVPAQSVTAYMTQFRAHLFNRPKMKRVHELPPLPAHTVYPGVDPISAEADTKEETSSKEDTSISNKNNNNIINNNKNFRLVLLGEQYRSIDTLETELPADMVALNRQCSAHPRRYQVTIGYEHLTADEVLRRLLTPTRTVRIPAPSLAPSTATTTAAATASANTEGGMVGGKSEGKLKEEEKSNVLEIPSSFEQVGHVAHLNLREEMLAHKQLIGEVLLDKNAAIRTVINKIGNIETEFRTFPMEVIAGVDDLNVTVRESGAKFNFNFRDVYWNSRLQMEHSRVIDIIRSRASFPCSPSLSRPLIVADIMAGVGPFAVPLALPSIPEKTEIHKNSTNKKRSGSRDQNQQQKQKNSDKKSASAAGSREVIVYANDLNPASYKYLVENARVNRCPAHRLKAFNLDGREFVVRLVERRVHFEEAVMNLPQNALEFLDAFIGLCHRTDPSTGVPYWQLSGKPLIETTTENKKNTTTTNTSSTSASPAFVTTSPPDNYAPLPRIHVYAFSTYMEDPVWDVAHRAAQVLLCNVADIYSITTPQNYTNSGSNSSNKAEKDGVYDNDSKLTISRTSKTSSTTTTAAEGAAAAADVSASTSCSKDLHGNLQTMGHIVRDVSPKKVMVCLSFTLPRSVAFAAPTVHFPPSEGSGQQEKGVKQNRNASSPKKRSFEDTQA